MWLEGCTRSDDDAVVLQDLSRTRAPQASGVPCSNGIAPGGETHTPNMCWENADNFVGLPHGSSRDREFAARKHGYVEFHACLYHVLHVLHDPWNGDSR